MHFKLILIFLNIVIAVNAKLLKKNHVSKALNATNFRKKDFLIQKLIKNTKLNCFFFFSFINFDKFAFFVE